MGISYESLHLVFLFYLQYAFYAIVYSNIIMFYF